MAGENASQEEIVAFVRLCIDSVETIEVLGLLLEFPDRAWTPELLSREIRSSAGSVAKRLDALMASRVIIHDEKESRYLPASAIMEKMVRELIAFYRLRPHRVMEILYSKPDTAMQSFADAFRFGRKDKP